MSAQHTPGPWVIRMEGREKQEINVRSSVQVPDEFDGGTYEPLIADLYRGGTGNIHDARLIAAAPDLLTPAARAWLPHAFLCDVMTAAGLVSHGKQCKALGERMADEVMRLRTAGPQLFLPLTDEQIDKIMQPLTRQPYSWREFARAIERAHGITGAQE